MPFVTVQLDDVLPECVEAACESITEIAEEIILAGATEPPSWEEMDADGRATDYIDATVPVMTHQIRAAWFLRHEELTKAYDDHGLGGEPFENDGLTAIFLYIESAVRRWYEENKVDIFTRVKKAEEK